MWMQPMEISRSFWREMLFSSQTQNNYLMTISVRFLRKYELVYTASDEFPVPECMATDKNFYMLNGACFDSYDYQSLYEFCCMRLDNGAAVVRFKFRNQEDFDEVYRQWIQSDGDEYIQDVARYYMGLYGLSTVEYHYGVLDNLKTMYFMF